MLFSGNLGGNIGGNLDGNVLGSVGSLSGVTFPTAIFHAHHGSGDRYGHLHRYDRERLRHGLSSPGAILVDPVAWRHVHHDV